MKIYEILLNHFGKQHWWPAQTKDEIVIGAVLTQNTSWVNVEKALNRMKALDACNLEALRKIEIENLEDLIRPTGFYRQKATYLKVIANFFYNFNENLDTLTFREQLLKVKGIGFETADSILLYGFERPVFVVDTYTKRLLSRHNLFTSNNYHDIQKFFESKLNKDVALYEEYHALIVQLGKTFCKKKPNCTRCPLRCVLD